MLGETLGQKLSRTYKSKKKGFKFSILSENSERMKTEKEGTQTSISIAEVLENITATKNGYAKQHKSI